MSEWKPVIDLTRGGYTEGFNKNRKLEYQRDGSVEIEVFRMCDASPYYNVSGVWWRELKTVVGQFEI